MKHLAIIPLIFSVINIANCETVRDIYRSDSISSMKVTITGASQEATIDLPPVKAIISDGENKSPMIVRFMVPFLATPRRECRIIMAMLARDFENENENLQVNVFDQPSDAVAVKCAFFDNGGLLLYSGDLLIEGLFDAGTTVTSPKRVAGVVCDAYYYEPSPTDLTNNFTGANLTSQEKQVRRRLNFSSLLNLIIKSSS